MLVIKNSLLPGDQMYDLRAAVAADGTEEALHGHEFIAIEMVLSGEVLHVIDGVEYLAHAGDIFFFDVGDKHSYHVIKDYTMLNIILKPEFYHNELLHREHALLVLPPFIRLPDKEKENCMRLMRYAMEEYDVKRVGYRTIVQSCIQMLVAHMFRFAAYSVSNPYNRMNEVLTYLEGHYTEAKLSEVAHMFNYSESYFSRLFKQNVGISFSKYITGKRMERAIFLVTFTDEKIENICHQVGYKDKTQFYKIFRQYTGTTPQRMRAERYAG